MRSSASGKPSCVTLSKAFSQSSSIMLSFARSWWALHTESMILLIMCIACAVLFFFLNPNCTFCRYGSIVSDSRFCMIAAKILYSEFDRDIGL